jgi:glycosyltransferase involved in cell wall biosynthesis
MRDQLVYRDDITKTKNKFHRRLLQSFVRFLTFGRYRASSLDYLRWSTIYALKKATVIITVSEFTKQEILFNYPWAKAAKIKAVHNGYPDEYRQLEAGAPMTAILNKYGLEKPFILYVGRLEKKKNTPFLIEAFSIMRENNPSLQEKLVLIGNASYGYDEVKYVIEEFDLNKEVIMPGWVEEADLPLIFNAATAFVFPTKYEGFGIPVLQALACGLPTAVSDIPVLHEVAGESVIYFNQDDRNDLARALALIVSDQNLRAKLAQNGPEQAKKFSWQQCARETLAVIENLK